MGLSYHAIVLLKLQLNADKVVGYLMVPFKLRERNMGAPVVDVSLLFLCVDELSEVADVGVQGPRCLLDADCWGWRRHWNWIEILMKM